MVLTRAEVASILRQLNGQERLFLSLLYKSVKTTMIYTHVLNRGGRGVQSPVDTPA